MRAAVVLFLIMFLLVLKGSNSFNAGSHHHKKVSYQPAQTIQKKQQNKSWYANQIFPVIKHDNLTEKKDEFISIADEDEDIVFSRKYVLLTKSHVVLATASVLHHFYSYTRNRLPFCSHFSYTSSYKYITQRVLRL
ncbi:hypothetical protein ACSBL2_23860 [Pedobacter sp. AW31-3R]|uniref:hypothetical protein n=1 Tax=Pedobacter sp. AW31-3R TaxID=3445781 RepID=UPI003F9EC916